MKYLLVQINPWEKSRKAKLEVDGLRLGDKVILQDSSGQELGVVVDFFGEDETTVEVVANQDVHKPMNDESMDVVRKATLEDLERLPKDEARKEAVNECKAMIKDRNLPMKLVDANYSFDGTKLTFAFISDGRVDFRDLVKDLSRKFGKSIRLHQIGIRDEARIAGDCGHCGRQLCCKGFLHDLNSITSDMAEVQQCVHRGSDRISGACGRLMCCLAYEAEGYKDLAAKMPPLGAKVNVDGKRGVILGHHTLKQTVDVEFDEGKEGRVRVEVDLNRHKK